jgi:hypothetical protein
MTVRKDSSARLLRPPRSVLFQLSLALAPLMVGRQHMWPRARSLIRLSQAVDQPATGVAAMMSR